MPYLRLALEGYDDSVSKLAYDVKTPEGLSSWMKRNLKYGYVNAKGEVSFDFESIGVDYRLQSPNQIIHSKVEVCWGQAQLEREILNILGISNRCYYIETNPMEMTHTFVVFDSDKGIYWFENSFEEHHGIHGPFKSDMDIVKKVANAIKSKSGINKVLYTSINGRPRDGLTTNGYLSFVKKFGLERL